MTSPNDQPAMKGAVAKALEIFRRYPDASHGETVAHLAPLVGDTDLAERLVEFVPIAFARVALADSGIKFQSTFYRLIDQHHFTHECPLSYEPLYEPALAIAREEQTQDVSEADRLAVLSRDAIFNAFSKLPLDAQDRLDRQLLNLTRHGVGQRGQLLTRIIERTGEAGREFLKSIGLIAG